MESTSKSEEPAYIFVKTEKQLKRLYLKEIQFIEGMENYIVIHTLTSKEIVHLRLKSILETLPAQIFYASAPLFHRESFLCTSDRRKSINHWGA